MLKKNLNMKSIFNLFILGILLTAFTGCTKEEVAEEASVKFIFDHVIDDKGLTPNMPIANPNAAGNNYNTSTLKYIISDLVLTDQSGNEVKYGNYDVIDAFGGNQIDGQTIPNGTYEKMSFTLGVSADVNSSNDPIGDLSPNGDMYFGGGEGYIFLKHEGKFLNSSNDVKDYSFEYGKSGNEITFDIPAGGLTVNGVNKTAYIVCNVQAFYASDTVDFNTGPIRTSSASDADWVKKMKANLPNAFTFFGSYEDK